MVDEDKKVFIRILISVHINTPYNGVYSKDGFVS